MCSILVVDRTRSAHVELARPHTRGAAVTRPVLVSRPTRVLMALGICLLGRALLAAFQRSSCLGVKNGSGRWRSIASVLAFCRADGRVVAQGRASSVGSRPVLRSGMICRGAGD
jgi:hypothetical protein